MANRPVHFEILGDDPQRLADFYRDVFGWEVAGWEGPQSYWLITTGGGGEPGIDGGLMHRHFNQAVINTIAVGSLDDTVKRVEAAGGKKVHGPNEIPGVGTHVYCTDPEGTLFGVLEPPSPAGGQ
jgi:uncharacterized protein